ncbi:MAG: carboxypeptidase regulatory-like domain-containing protein [Chloroflexota bacterium]
MNKSKPVLIIAALLLLLSAAVLWIYRPRPEQVAPGNDRFGLAFISPPDHLADEARFAGALATGVRWDRWPLYGHWVAAGGYAGPHPGGRHDYDTLVIEEIERGLQPLVILMGTPADPAPEPAPPSGDLPLPQPADSLTGSSATRPPAGLDRPIFQDGSDEPGPNKTINPANTWAWFVFSTVERYRPGGRLAWQQHWPAGQGVRHWEVWNEPDFDLFWQGTLAEYVRLLEVTYKSVKTADPQAVVLLGGLGFYEKPFWLGQVLQQSAARSGRPYFDAVSVHHYWSVYNSEARLNEVRALLDIYGYGHLPLWMTESGLSVWDDFPATAHHVSPDTPWRGTRAEQADYVIQHAALALFHGVERYFHFMLHDDCGDGPSTAFGLRQNFSPHQCNPAQGRPRPAYDAYQLVTEQFWELAPLWRQQTADVDQVAFYRPADQSRLLVVWDRRGLTTTTTIPATGSLAQLYWIDSSLPVAADPEPDRRRLVNRAPVEGGYLLALPPATNQNAADPNDTQYHIGGRPYLLVERDTLPPTSTITALPPTRPATFVVAWQGDDPGSGIDSYDVWLSRDGRPLEPWLSHTTATQAEFSGQPGQRYAFAVRARDRAGNEEPRPTAAQAAATVVTGSTRLGGVVLGPNREPVSGATVTLTEAGQPPRQLTTRDDGTWPPLPLLPGRYTLQAGAAGYSRWPAGRSIQLEADTTLLLTLAPPDNAIAGGDFEGTAVWQYWAWEGQVDLFFEAFDGQWAARLGHGRGQAAAACPAAGRTGQRWAIWQPVTVPDSGRTALSFVRRIAAPQAAPAEAWLEAALIAGDQTHTLIPPAKLSQPSDWTLTALDLTPWRGQTVTVRFQVVRCSEQPFTVTLDRISSGNYPQ